MILQNFYSAVKHLHFLCSLYENDIYNDIAIDSGKFMCYHEVGDKPEILQTEDNTMLRMKKVICSALAAAAVLSAATVPSSPLSKNSPAVLTAEATAPLGTLEALQNVNIRISPTVTSQKIGLLCGGKRVSYYNICGDWVSISPTDCRWVCMSYVRKIS